MAYIEEVGCEARQPDDDALMHEELAKRLEVSRQRVKAAQHELRVHRAVVRACEAALDQLAKKEPNATDGECEKGML